MTLIKILFWASLLPLLHTYIFYPFLLKILSVRKKKKGEIFNSSMNLPFVSVLIAAYNEEKVLAEKIDSILRDNYPAQIEILIGSDCSNDGTNQILENYSKKSAIIQAFYFRTRQGKGSIINFLAEKAKGEILIITDANVFFSANTVFNLIRQFKDPEIGLVDANIKHKKPVSGGISIQESIYISHEIILKNREGQLWGTMMGPFGGCFAIRKIFYRNIPGNFLADDFYLNMQVLKQGKKAVNDLEAIVYEDLSHEMNEEFRRRIRISTGSFQNLFHFSNLLFPPWQPLAFSFISHKILRWFGPFFLSTVFIANIFLFPSSTFYKITLFIQLGLITITLLDLLLQKYRVQIIILRFITHFYSMNAALFWGFVKFTKGVKSNVWKPTKRNQQETKHN